MRKLFPVILRYATISIVCLALLVLSPDWHWSFEIANNLPTFLYYPCLALIPVLLLSRDFLSPVFRLAAVILLSWCAYVWSLMAGPLILPAWSGATQQAQVFRATFVPSLDPESFQSSHELLRQIDLAAIVAKDNRSLQDRFDFPFSAKSGPFELLSRHRLLETEHKDAGDFMPPVLIARVDYHDQPILAVVLQSAAPISSANLELNKVYLRRISGFLRYVEDRVIVFGAMNASPFSPQYDRFVAGAYLSNAAQGAGIFSGFASTLFVPIDFILYKGPWGAVNFKRDESVGMYSAEFINYVR